MEEDIKVLEELIEDYYLNREIVCVKDIQAIENLIKGYKELEECLKAEEKYAEGLNNDIKSLLNIEPNDNFIPKSKVREKIEEMEKKQVLHSRYGEIKVLQELLEERN